MDLLKKILGIKKNDAAHALLRPDVQVIKQNNFYLHSNWSPSFVTDQFIENADIYHDRYFNRLDFLNLADQYFTAAKIDRNLPSLCLDIGSGSGSSVFASAKLLPNASIIASDISFQLLELLSTFVQSQPELRSRITTYCFDLHMPFFRKNLFDVVVGTAIMHHLLDPYEALKNVAISLKPNGKIILVEPLESGSLILVMIFEKILEVLKHLKDDQGPIANLMRAMRLDIQSRLGVPVQKPWTKFLDDKWVFDGPYLENLAENLGLSAVSVTPTPLDLTRIYEVTFLSLLRDSGNGDVPVPAAVSAIVQEFDQGISVNLKQKLCPTGIIIFTK